MLRGLSGRIEWMLFGTRAYRAELYRAINEVSHRQRFDVIYAGTVGSISRGISSCKADYDVKCLYVRSVKWGGYFRSSL